MLTQFSIWHIIVMNLCLCILRYTKFKKNFFFIFQKDNLKRLFVKIQGDPARCEYYNENHYHNNNTYYLCVVQTNALRYHPSNHVSILSYNISNCHY